MKALIAGGAGYIGGVTARLFVENGHDVAILDNLSTGHKHNNPDIPLVAADLTDAQTVTRALKEHKFDVILHFAAKIQVEESVSHPGLYFENNVVGALNLIEAATQAGIKRFIFSSTAAVYGEPTSTPIAEDEPKNPINPYGLSKYLVEQILQSYGQTHLLNWVAFRYFNAAGAYGGIGPEYPKITHLISRAIESIKNGDELKVFGSDYPTNDGTCVRDFIHVHDVARAHVIAAEQMIKGQKICLPINLGSNQGCSVLEIIKLLEEVSDQKIKFKLAKRRAGDSARLIASNKRARELLEWQPQHDLTQILKDAWNWQKLKKL